MSKNQPTKHQLANPVKHLSVPFDSAAFSLIPITIFTPSQYNLICSPLILLGPWLIWVLHAPEVIETVYLFTQARSGVSTNWESSLVPISSKLGAETSRQPKKHRKAGQSFVVQVYIDFHYIADFCRPSYLGQGSEKLWSLSDTVILSEVPSVNTAILAKLHLYLYSLFCLVRWFYCRGTKHSFAGIAVSTVGALCWYSMQVFLYW